MNARRRWLRLALGLLAAAALLVVAGRLFFFGVYRVEKRSMMPTLHGAAEGGDVVLVWFDRGAIPARFDMTVVQGGDGEQPFVKRTVGLPGEELEVRLGDLVIDGALLPITEPRPAPVVLFDDRLQDVEHWFDYARDASIWTHNDDAWHLDSRDVPAGTTQDRMFYARRALDGWVDAEGVVEEGLDMVNDLVLDFEVRLGDPPAALRFGLLEMGDIYEVELARIEGSRWSARLVNRWVSMQGAGSDVLAEAEVELEQQRWYALRFVNVDDQVALAIDGRTIFLVAYDRNRFHPQDEQLRRGVSLGARAWFGGPRGLASFRKIRLSRDLYYTRRGERGITAPVQLGPDRIFLLGDNSPESLDSRDFGPVPLADVLGRPTCVLWPPNRIRTLPAPEPLVAPR